MISKASENGPRRSSPNKLLIAVGLSTMVLCDESLPPEAIDTKEETHEKAIDILVKSDRDFQQNKHDFLLWKRSILPLMDEKKPLEASEHVIVAQERIIQERQAGNLTEDLLVPFEAEVNQKAQKIYFEAAKMYLSQIPESISEDDTLEKHIISFYQQGELFLEKAREAGVTGKEIDSLEENLRVAGIKVYLAHAKQNLKLIKSLKSSSSFIPNFTRVEYLIEEAKKLGATDEETASLEILLETRKAELK